MPNGNDDIYNRQWCDERYHTLQWDIGRVREDSERRAADLQEAVSGLSQDITQAARLQGRLIGIGLGIFSILNLGLLALGLFLGGAA
jgi:hypothetical protein